MSEPPRYFTVAERLAQPPVSSIELMPSPSMYDELLRPLWWTPGGLRLTQERCQCQCGWETDDRAALADHLTHLLECLPLEPDFQGLEPRECGEHRTVGPHRAWCFDCGEWCYPGAPCVRCEVATLRKEAEAPPMGDDA